MTEKITAAEFIQINVKPLSVNGCWQGRRFKTPDYKHYEIKCKLLLPKIVIPLGVLKISFDFGISYAGFDFDNAIKPFMDILQKKYGFNDSRVWEANIKKTKTEKGQEFVKFKIEQL
jgi:Holliday junction resolvase RusA-like endonuclease